MKVRIIGPFTIKGKTGEEVATIQSNTIDGNIHLIKVDGQLYQFGTLDFQYGVEHELGKLEDETESN